MIAIENLPTEKLFVYLNILEKFTTMNAELLSWADDAINRRIAPKSRFDPICDKIMASAKKNDEMVVMLQKELDKRLKKDLGISNGTKFQQGLFEEFNKLMEEIHKDSQQPKIIGIDKPQ